MFTSNTLIDNTEKLKLVDVLKTIISNPAINHLQIATGYWDIPGTTLLFDELTSFFHRGGRLDLLIGREPALRNYQLRDDLTAEERKFPDFYIKRDIDKLHPRFKPTIELILNNTNADKEEESRIKIHVYGQGEVEQFLHAKCYIAYTEETPGDPIDAKGIIGSSNFTEKGLRDNAELNYLETNPQIVASPKAVGHFKSHRVWFEEMWQNSEPWTGKFIKEILKPSPVGIEIEKEKTPEPLSPYEVYIKYLQLQFGDMVNAEVSEILKSYLPEEFSPYDYQMDAVKQCFSIMKKYGGFLLGDVVGLGKTIVGVLLIRHFLENAKSFGREAKVLIITTPSIQSAWIETIEVFDKNSKNNISLAVDYVTTGSVNKIGEEDDIEDVEVDGDEIEDLESKNYGLIIIDESHNFRNKETQKYKAVDDFIGSIRPTPWVALLSATPQNNSPYDIYHQILLFERNPNRTKLPNVEGGKLGTFFTQMEKTYKEAGKIPQDTEKGREEARKIIKEVSERIRTSVLNDIMVRRTRSDVKKMYGSDAKRLHFPDIVGPHKLEYEMDDELASLFADTTEAIALLEKEQFDPTKHIGFYRYTAISHFKNDDNTKLYEKRNLKVEAISRRLKRIMQILLVKRLESSITAFKTSLKNLHRYNEVMIDMIENDCVFICPDIDVNKIHRESEGDFEKFKTTMEGLIKKKKKNNRQFVSSDFTDDYIVKLKNDKRLIEQLIKRWDANDFDPKAEEFSRAIDKELFNPAINNPSGKDKPHLVIFTEAKDTLNSIERKLKAKGHRVLAINAKNRAKKQKEIKENFDANLDKDKQKDDYDVIVTTEVLAEGVNLHRSNVILNYDAPWNATRLMQRIGRVNRIGSKEKEVHVFNFFPSTKGNAQIRLIEKAYAKLQSFHEMFGEDNKVFSEREELTTHELKKIVEGELSPFAPFINELREYQESNPGRYDYISGLEAEEIGGSITKVEDNDALFIFTDDNGGYMSVEVKFENGIPTPRIISSLATMEFLKCNPGVKFVTTQIGDNKLLEIAQNEYHQYVTNFVTAKELNKNAKKARGLISEARKKYELTDETKTFLKTIEKQIKANNSTVIKQVISHLENYQPGLWGADDDFNSLIQSTFRVSRDQAVKKRGDSKLAIFEIKL